jgi:hypothetical protein
VYQVGKETKYLQMMYGQPSIKINIIAWATNFSLIKEKRVGDFIVLVRVT